MFTPSVTVAVIVASVNAVEPSNTARILLFAEVCVIFATLELAIPELDIETVVGVPSGSVTVYDTSNVKLVESILAVVLLKVIDGLVFTIDILYQPPPDFMNSSLLAVVKYKAPLFIPVGGNGSAALLATIVTGSCPIIPAPGRILEVESPDLITKSPLSAPSSTFPDVIPTATPLAKFLIL